MAAIQLIKYPWGPMDIQAVTDAAAPAATISNTKTKLNMPVTQNMTLSLTAEQSLLPGSEVTIELVQGGTGRNVAFGGTNIKAPALTGTLNKTERIVLVWDGTQFAANSAWVSI